MSNTKDLLLVDFLSNPKLSVRACNICYAVGVRTLRQLADFLTDNQNLLKVRNCGVKTREEIFFFFERHKHLLLSDTSYRSEAKKEKIRVVLSSLEESRFNEIFKAEFLFLSIRAQNGLLDIFNNKLPTFSEFSNKFIDGNVEFSDIRNIGAKSAAELSKFVQRIKELINMTISKAMSASEEIAFKIKILTEITISDPAILNNILNREFNIFSFLNENLKQILNLTAIEDHLVRKSLDVSNDKPFKAKVTKERLRQISKRLLDEVPQILYAKCKPLIEYTRIYETILSLDFTDIEMFSWEPLDIKASIHNYKLFSVFILGNILKDSLYSLSKLDKIKKPGLIQNYDHYNSNKIIKGYYLVNNKVLAKHTLTEIYSHIFSELCKRQEEDIIFSIEAYFLKSGSCNYESFFNTIKYILNKELFGIAINDNTVVIKRNTPKLVYEYAIEALSLLGRPSHISNIYEQILKLHPSFESSDDSLKNTITRNKDIFIYFGRSSTYGLKIWEETFNNIKGGTIRDIIQEFLEDLDRPCHISAIAAYVSKYRKTNEVSIVGNLKIAGERRFRFFKNAYIGLSSKEYEKEKDSPVELKEVSLNELLANIFSK